MAASLYKWSFLSLSVAFLSSFSIRQPATSIQQPATSYLHPFHVSVTEINHNKEDKTLEISCKIFTDDFEKILAKNYKTKADLGREDMKTAMDSLVKKYVQSHLLIQADGKAVRYTYLGYEIESEATFSYIEVENISTVSKLTINNSILYDQFDDQLNIMHVTVKGERKSGKLNYPEREMSFVF